MVIGTPEPPACRGLAGGSERDGSDYQRDSPWLETGVPSDSQCASVVDGMSTRGLFLFGLVEVHSAIIALPFLTITEWRIVHFVRSTARATRLPIPPMFSHVSTVSP